MGGRKRKAAASPGPGPEDVSYAEKRKRNNLAVTKSREKSRQLEAETTERVRQLKDENSQLERRVEVLNRELAFLKEMFVAYASGKGAAASDVPASSSSADGRLPSSKAEAERSFDLLASDTSPPSSNSRSGDS